jgi:hypothetical protein
MARWYASHEGRFMSPDPGHVGADPKNPQTWNLYVYGINDSINITDPTGLFPWGELGLAGIHLGGLIIFGELSGEEQGGRIAPTRTPDRAACCDAGEFERFMADRIQPAIALLNAQRFSPQCKSLFSSISALRPGNPALVPADLVADLRRTIFSDGKGINYADIYGAGFERERSQILNTTALQDMSAAGWMMTYGRAALGQTPGNHIAINVKEWERQNVQGVRQDAAIILHEKTHNFGYTDGENAQGVTNAIGRSVTTLESIGVIQNSCVR